MHRHTIVGLLTALLILISAGCGREAQRRAQQGAAVQMDHAAALMEEHPDSALTILQSVDSAALSDRPLKARFSLLMAQAVEKTSDLTDLKVIQDAADYYLDYGSSMEKMITYYHLGCIYKSQGDNFKALELFNRAESFGSETNDTLSFARILVAKGTILYRIKNWDQYLQANQQAANLLLQLNDSVRYYTTLLRIATAYSSKNDFDNQLIYLQKVRKEYPRMSENIRKLYYYPELMLHYQKNGNKDSLQATIDEYLITVKNINAYDSLDFVGAYLVMNLPQEARRYLPAETADTSFMYRKRWIGTVAYLFEVEGDSKSALIYQERFNAMEDSVKNRNLAQSTNVLNDRFEIEQQVHEKDSKLKNSLIWLIILIVGLISTGILVVVFRRRSIKNHEDYLKVSKANEAISGSLKDAHNLHQTLNSNLEQITQQRDSALKELGSVSEERDLLAKELISVTEKINQAMKALIDEKFQLQEARKAIHLDRSALNKYLDQFNKIIMACHTKEGYYADIASDTVNEIIASEDTFLKHAEQLYQTKYPYNVDVLKRLGLTEIQLKICYLVDLGMQSKHIEKFLTVGNIYNLSNSIRDKLGITKSRFRLKTWLAKDLTTLPKFQALQENSSQEEY